MEIPELDKLATKEELRVANDRISELDSRINTLASLVDKLVFPSTTIPNPIILPKPVVIPATIKDSEIPQPPADALNTNDFFGDDLGEKINRANAALGDKAGSIIVNPGTILKQVKLSPNRKLFFKEGVFGIVNSSDKSRDWFGAILLNHRNSLFGSGEDKTIFLEPDKFGYIIIQSVGDAEQFSGGIVNSSITEDITLSHFTLLGSSMQKPEGGVRSSIQLGNAKKVRAHYITLNSISCLGFTVGGNSLQGNHADDWIRHHLTFIKSGSQALNIVNGQNIVDEDITFLATGKFIKEQGVTCYDIEPNDPKDIIRNIQLRRVLIDSTNSPLADGKPNVHGNGILVQNNVGTLDFGPVLIEDAKVIGGPLIQNFGGRIATGVYIGGKIAKVDVKRVQVIRVSQCGFRFEEAIDCGGEDLEVISGGTGGLEAFDVLNTSHSVFKNIKASVDPNSLTANDHITERGISDFNDFINCSPKPTLNGKKSIIS